MKRTKLFFIQTILFFAVALSFAESYLGKNAVVDSPDVTALSNLSKTERDSVQSMVKSNLESNLSEYLGMVLTGDAQTTERIKKTVAAQSESGAYHDGGVEIGKFEHSFYLIESKVLKVGSNHSISVTFHDLTKNTHTTVATRKTYSNVENLSSHPGAVDEVTILLCDRLGVSLSSLDRNILTNGALNLNEDQRLARANNELETIKKQQEELKKQAQAAAASTDLNSKTELARIQAQIEDMNERQKAAAKKANRLAQEKAARDEELRKNSTRNSEQQQKIIQEAREVERLAAQVRSQKLQSASIYSKFKLLENKKSTLLSLKQDMNSRISEVEKERDAEVAQKKSEILNREYRRAELSGGKPTDAALKIRQQEANSATSVISQQAQVQILEIKKNYTDSIKMIAEDIVDGYENLSKEDYEFSSIANPDELVYTVDNFDGAKKGWPIAVYLYSDGVNISEFHLFIPYKNLYKAIEEKDPVLQGEEFFDMVDLYESLFAQKSKFINCELKVHESVVYKTPSRYLTDNLVFTITSLKTGNTVLTEKVFEYQKNKEKSWWYTFYSNQQDVSAYVDPIVSERKIKYDAELKAQRAQEAERQRKLEAERKAQEKAIAKEKFKNNQKGRRGIFIDLGYGGNDYDSGPQAAVDILFGGRHFFFGGEAEYRYGLDMREYTDKVSYVIAKNNSKYRTLKSTDCARFLGVAGMSVQLGGFRPYFMAGGGYYMNTYRSDSVVYKEDPRYGSGGTIEQGATVLFGGGADFGSGKTTFGFNIKAYTDIGVGTSISGSLCIGRRLFW